MSINYNNLLVKSGYRVKDFCGVLNITTKQFYHYFKEGAYSETYLRQLFARYDEVMEMITGKSKPAPLEERIVLKPEFKDYNKLTRISGLRTKEAKAKYFKVTTIAIEEVEHYITNRGTIYITQLDAGKVEAGLHNLRILFVS